MPPVPAVAAIVTATAMAIFSGDIPGALLRIPGTPASAAYTDEAYAMTLKGQAEVALGAGLVFSAIGGLFGTLVMMPSAPALADIALKFSSFEYFWLVVLGLAGAVFIGNASVLKACDLAAARPADRLHRAAKTRRRYPRFTFGITELAGGVELIPMMVGMFAVSEILRYMVDTAPPPNWSTEKIGSVFAGMWALLKKYKWPLVRGSALGTMIGIQPGSGAGHGGVDVVRDEQEILEGAGEVRHRARRGHRRERAPPTTARSPARGFRRSCSAFPATRSPRSRSACST